MLKLVTEKIRKIINNHVSVNSKIIEIHCKNKRFWSFRRLHVRMVKVSKKHQKWDQKSISKSMKNRYKNHARKRGSQKMRIHQTKIIKKGNKEHEVTEIMTERKERTKRRNGRTHLFTHFPFYAASGFLILGLGEKNILPMQLVGARLGGSCTPPDY